MNSIETIRKKKDKREQESVPFRRIKRNFGIVEKTFVVLHGLSMFDYSAVPPCK